MKYFIISLVAISLLSCSANRFYKGMHITISGKPPIEYQSTRFTGDPVMIDPMARTEAFMAILKTELEKKGITVDFVTGAHVDEVKNRKELRLQIPMIMIRELGGGIPAPPGQGQEQMKDAVGVEITAGGTLVGCNKKLNQVTYMVNDVLRIEPEEMQKMLDENPKLKADDVAVRYTAEKLAAGICEKVVEHRKSKK